MTTATGRTARDLGPWFYDFELPDGTRTAPDLPETLRGIHATRAGLLRDAFARLGESLPADASVLDVGCHQGFFSVCLHGLAGGRVVGVDVRGEHVRNAAFIADSLGLSRASFETLDAEHLDRRFGTEPAFDLVVCFGLIYHLENPIGVLRRAAALARHALVVETQLVDDLDERVEWGRRGHAFPSAGRFVLVDESPVHATNRETGGTPLALCPSPRAVSTVLDRLGFGCETLPAPADAHEQFARGRRAVFLARRR